MTGSQGMTPNVKSGTLFFGLSLLILWESLRLGLGVATEPGPGFFPFCAGTILLCLSLAFVYQGWRVQKSLPPLSRRVIIAMACVFVYSLVMDYLGFVIATFVLVAGLFRLGEPRRWWAVLAMSAGVTFIAYYFFGTVLKVFFPKGIVGL